MDGVESPPGVDLITMGRKKMEEGEGEEGEEEGKS